MIPFYPVACLGHMVSNGRRMAVTRQRFEVFRFSVMQSTFCFSNIAIITIPAASLINYFRPMGALKSVFIGEKRLNLASVSENDQQSTINNHRTCKYMILAVE